MNPPTVPDAGHVSHSWAGTSLDLTTEEGRAFLQERRSLPTLLAIDAGMPVLVSLDMAAQVILTPGRVPGQEWAILLTLINMLGARAVFVPSPPRRTLAIGLVASVPVAVASIVYQTTARREGTRPWP